MLLNVLSFGEPFIFSGVMLLAEHSHRKGMKLSQQQNCNIKSKSSLIGASSPYLLLLISVISFMHVPKHKIKNLIITRQLQGTLTARSLSHSIGHSILFSAQCFCAYLISHRVHLPCNPLSCHFHALHLSTTSSPVHSAVLFKLYAFAFNKM